MLGYAPERVRGEVLGCIAIPAEVVQPFGRCRLGSTSLSFANFGLRLTGLRKFANSGHGILSDMFSPFRRIFWRLACLSFSWRSLPLVALSRLASLALPGFSSRAECTALLLSSPYDRVWADAALQSVNAARCHFNRRRAPRKWGAAASSMDPRPLQTLSGSEPRL